jgi:hypothetical protein
VEHYTVFDAEPTVAVTHSVMLGDPARVHRAFEWTGFGPRCAEFLAATGDAMTMFGSGHRLVGVATSDAASNHLSSTPRLRRELTNRTWEPRSSRAVCIQRYVRFGLR